MKHTMGNVLEGVKKFMTHMIFPSFHIENFVDHEIYSFIPSEPLQQDGIQMDILM